MWDDTVLLISVHIVLCYAFAAYVILCVMTLTLKAAFI